jgi:hypothetical protein
MPRTIDNAPWLPLHALGTGLAEVPPDDLPELTRGLPDYEQRDPSALAAMRVRNSVRPIAGRAGEGPSVRDVLNMTAIGRLANTVPTLVDVLTNPGSPAMRDIEIPRTSSGPSLGDILGTTPARSADDPKAPKAQSIDAPFGEPQPERPSGIQNAINSVNKTVAAQRKQLEQLGNSLARGAIDKREYDQRRVGPDSAIARADAMIKEIDAPYQRDFTAWETRKNSYLTDQSTAVQRLATERANAERPFRIKHPEATQNIVAGGGALTGLTALTLGALSRGKLKPSFAAGGIGATEGALTANAPELLDLSGFQPRGGDAWNKTLNQMLGKESLVATGADALLHGGGAMAGSYATSLGPKVYGRVRENISNWRSPGPQPQPPGPATPPTTPNAPLPELGGSAGTPSQGGPISPAPSSPQPTVFTRGGQTFAHMPDGRVLLQSGSGWHLPNGRLIKKTEWPTLGDLGKTPRAQD